MNSRTALRTEEQKMSVGGEGGTGVEKKDCTPLHCCQADITPQASPGQRIAALWRGLLLVLDGSRPLCEAIGTLWVVETCTSNVFASVALANWKSFSRDLS